MYIKTYASKYLPNFKGTATPSFSMARFSPVSLSPAIGAATPGMVCRNCWRIKAESFPEPVERGGLVTDQAYREVLLLYCGGPQTHMLTHTRKRAGGNNGHRSVGEYGPPDGKGHKRARTQEISFSQSVGKDEVSGSNPDSSSTKSPFSLEKGGFCFAFVTF